MGTMGTSELREALGLFGGGLLTDHVIFRGSRRDYLMRQVLGHSYITDGVRWLLIILRHYDYISSGRVK